MREKNLENWVPRKNKKFLVKKNSNPRLDYTLELQGSHAFYFLTQEGNDIWSLIDGKRTIKQIVNELQKTYKTDKEELYKDVFDFLLLLVGKKLIF